MGLRARRRKALVGVARVGTGLTGMHSLDRLAQDLAAPRFMLLYFSDSTLVSYLTNKHAIINRWPRPRLTVEMGVATVRFRDGRGTYPAGSGS